MLSSNAGLVIEQNAKTSDNELGTVGSIGEQETRELLSEMPNVTVNDNIVTINEDEGVATGSQNSSSAQYEFEQERSEAGHEPDLADSTRSVAEKQKGKRISRYNRRGRSRGKGAK